MNAILLKFMKDIELNACKLLAISTSHVSMFQKNSDIYLTILMNYKSFLKKFNSLNKKIELSQFNPSEII